MSESHADQTPVHLPFAEVYADAAARTAATGFPRGFGAAVVPFAGSDVGKIVWQLDNNSLWILLAVTPTWLQFDGVGWAAALAAHVAAADPHAGYQKESEKGAAGGYASLDGGGLIPITQLPALAINDTFPVASQAAMLALTAQRGDVAIRSDNGNSYILSTDSPGTLADWKQITISGGTPGSHASTHQDGGADEISVAGLSGVLADPQTPITENVQDIVAAMFADGPVDFTYDDAGAGGIAHTIKTVICIACSDETTALVAGAAKVTFRMPHAMTLTAVRASLTGAAGSGTFTVDINEGGSTILSTKLTIDATEKTSTTAAAAPVISDAALADDAEITIDIDDDAAGDAVGLKIYLIGTRA